MRTHRFAQIAVASIVAFAALPVASAHAVVSVRWDGTVLSLAASSTNIAVSCSSAGFVIVNGAPLRSPIRCAEPSQLFVTSQVVSSTASGTIDLRAITLARFGRLRTVEALAYYPATIYGSEFVDNLTLFNGGTAYGFGNYDAMQGGPGSVLWGGPGNDVLRGLSGARLEGGDGDDSLAIEGAGGSISGGRGRDLLFGRFSTASIFGGPGSDEIYTSVGAAGDRVVDAGPDGDKVHVEVGLTEALIKVAPVPDAEPKLRVKEGTATADVENAETLFVEGLLNNDLVARSHDVTMTTTTKVVLEPVRSGPLTVRVPGGEWTRKPSSISAPGLRPVEWNPALASQFTSIKIVAA